MNENIEEVYAAQVRWRAADPRYGAVSQMLHGFAKDTGFRIRSDAVYFLANNLIDLVATPLSVARRSGIAPDGDKMTDKDGSANDYADDLRRVVNAAAEEARQRGRNEISSTSALIGLSKVIDDLGISDMKIWGRSSS
jgi:hypothetical protein